MTKGLEQNEKKAEGISIIPKGTEKVEFIRSIQELEGHAPCFAQSDGKCPETNCRFRQECQASPADKFEIDYSRLPALDLEDYEPDIKEEPGVKDESKGSVSYAWIGVGQCGARLVKSFYNLGYKKALSIGTSRHDLDSLDIPLSQKFLMETGKDGTGSDMGRCTKAIQQHQQDILHRSSQIFGTQIDHIMVCFGAGGGMGSGSVFGVIDIAKKYARYVGLENPDKKVGVIMTLPSTGKVDSTLVAKNAYKVANELSQMATAGKISPLIIVDNDKINKMYPGMTVKSLWPSINNTFAGLFDIFNRLSGFSSPYTSFDPSDYLSIIESGGCLIMSRTKVDRLDDKFGISEAVTKNLERTLFAGGLVSTAKLGACIVVGGKKLMADVKGLQDNIDYAFDVFAEITGQATIHRGIYEDNSDSLRVYTIIGGLDNPTARLEELNSESYFRPNIPANIPDNISDIESPPLWERKAEILILAEYFLAKEAKFYDRPEKILSSDTKKLLLNYSWPGNVRELAKAMERAHELATGQEIQPDALPFEIIFADSEPYPKEILSALDEVRRRIIVKALELPQQREPTARLLGIEPRRLDHLIENFNISLAKRNASS
ncbi:MAG: AAA-type ATPase lid domain-containing protein [Planctomycetota bacterium]